MKFVYHIIVHAVLLASAPYLLLRSCFDSRFRTDILARIRSPQNLPQGKIWIHASSAGEVRAAAILRRALIASGHEPILSTFTATGFDLAQKENLTPVFRLPPDSPLWMTSLLDQLRPASLALIEAELWPGLLWECQRRGIPVLLVNGRMSARSAERYGKFPGFFRKLAEAIRIFSMRGEQDAERVRSLGIPENKIRISGNIKFDAPAAEPASVPAGLAPQIVFGSTRPGDEGPALDAVRKLREHFPGLRCALAPRHIQRCQEVEGLLRDYGIAFAKHSQLGGSDDPAFILVDTVGDLNGYYARCDVAFVGGGFNPAFGGHNILEPAAFGKPVVFGRHMNNFAEEAKLLADCGGGIQIDSPEELYPALKNLLTDAGNRESRGQSAAQAVAKNRGALQKNMDLILANLK